MNREQLIETCASTCYFAQNHSNDEECWGPRGTTFLEERMEHVSFVVSCYLAQNTKLGQYGVDFNIVLKKLAGEVLEKEQWVEVITELVDEFNKELAD